MDTFDYDTRFASTLMFGSPTPTVLICLSYLIFVKILGPAWMRNRKPYELRRLLILHNFTLVIASGWMFYSFGRHGWFWRYNWTCANIDYLETDEDSLAIVKVSRFYVISKFLEMLDTVFFILRKKESQITFLHVVHHASVPIISWCLGYLGASGYNTLFAFVNSFVHIWMYLYYGLSALGPSVQKHLWWKKYLTSLQILQFCLVTLAMISVIVTPGCKVSAAIVGINLGTAIFFLVLFANFYRNSYRIHSNRKSFVNGSCHQALHRKLE